jgi:hypothetical protein
MECLALVHQLTLLYKDIKRYLPSFLKLFRIMKEQRMMNEQDVVDALKLAKELPHLKTLSTVKRRDTET